jgi:tRNA (cmo5U34)-methyltransferase
MSKYQQTLDQYKESRASKYDVESKIIRGDRDRHIILLHDVMEYLNGLFKISTLIELACGTGFFTRFIAEKFKNLDIVAFDGSMEMIDEAKKDNKLKKITFIYSLFSDIPWQNLSNQPNVVFSAFAIHHIQDEDKWELYQKIYDSLTNPGAFILFDVFKTGESISDQILEYLCCYDIKRGYEKITGKFIDIDKIIETDRINKIKEGDVEGTFNDHMDHLKDIGFSNVTWLFQDNRYGAILAIK